MLTIPIQGKKDGKHEIELSAPVSDFESIFPEFIGDVVLRGWMTKLGNRISLQLTATANACLNCDYSLQEYQEEITAELAISYLLDTELYALRSANEDDDTYQVHVLRSDAKELNITDEVAQELSVRLPLKRIAPQYRDKEITDIVQDEHIIPEGGGGESHNQETDERWAALKQIKFNN